MQAISQELNESVSLALLSRGEALVLAFIESTSAFHVVTRVVAKLPAHCTVQGKIMLAHMTRAEVKRILREHGMQIYTPNTLHSFEALEPELERIRREGYAVDNGEFHIGLSSVAAPIYDENGSVCYSFSIVSMFHRIGSPEFAHAKELVLSAARDISHALGYQGGAFQGLTDDWDAADSADAAALRDYLNALISLRERAYKDEQSRAEALAAAGDFSGYERLGYSSEEIEKLRTAWAVKNPKLARALAALGGSSGGGTAAVSVVRKKTQTEEEKPAKKNLGGGGGVMLQMTR